MTRSDSEVLKWWPSFHHCCAISLHKIIIRFQCLVSGCRYTKELFQHSPPFADLGVLIYTSLTLESLYLFHGKRVLKFVLLSQNSHSNQDRWIDGTEKERERERERERKRRRRKLEENKTGSLNRARRTGLLYSNRFQFNDPWRRLRGHLPCTSSGIPLCSPFYLAIGVVLTDIDDTLSVDTDRLCRGHIADGRPSCFCYCFTEMWWKYRKQLLPQALQK